MADADKTSGLDIRLLGPVKVHYRGSELNLGGVQARSVFAVLMLHPGHVVARTVIARDAWRGDPPDTARTLIADYISRLRTTLAPAADHVRLEAVRPGFRATIDPALIDAHRFNALLRQAGQDHAAHEDELAATHLEQALALWRGHALALEDLEADWLRDQAAILENQRRRTLEQLAALHLTADRPHRAVDLLRDQIPRHPERDELAALLVQALAAAGENAQAIEAADRAIDALDQAGLPIGPKLREARRAAHRAPATHATPVPLRMLPTDSRAFTGREPELTSLLDLAETAHTGATPGTVVISAIDGMGGVGKTALAVHAGHRLAARFPNGQLFVDLHGYTQNLPPLAAFDALGSFLQAFGIPPQLIPPDLDGRAALYRDRLADKRMLILLDNANSEDQVRPLLPGNPDCLVLVTSRLRLTALHDAHVLSLDVLPIADAITLLRRIAGPGRITADDPLLEEIAVRCGCLPLTIRIAAAQLRHHPTWTLNHLADQLREQQTRVANLDDGDRQLTAALNLSYDALNDRQKHDFRQLGLIPGPDTDPYATAALLDTDPHTSAALLNDLYAHNLIGEPKVRRYQYHDLIRVYAINLANTTEPPDGHEAALDRLLYYYAHTARRADALIARVPRPRPGGTGPRHAPALLDRQAAQVWLRTERASLDAAFDHAYKRGMAPHVVALAAGLAEISITDGPWSRGLDLHQNAAEIAERSNQPAAHATALTDLGTVRRLTGDLPGATNDQTRALEICRETGNRLGEANALHELGRVQRLTGDLPRAVAAHTGSSSLTVLSAC